MSPRGHRLGAALAALAASLAATEARAQFTYRPAGELVAGSGTGRRDMTNYAPGMRFPIEVAPAYLNSQVWGRGGGSGPGGSQCDAQNYAYPWRDNYCESRSWTMPMCPSGRGHQGQDIRGSTCRDNTHWVVAGAAGRVSNVGSYSVYITGDDGVRYDYLHMRSVQVAVGDRVTRGERIGKVSNAFGGTPTTIHLHFNLYRAVSGFGMVYAPTYGALVESYQRLLGVAPAMDAGVSADAAVSDAARVDVVAPRDVVALDVAPPRDATVIDAARVDVVAPRDAGSVDVVATVDAARVDVVASRDVVAVRDAAAPRDVVEPEPDVLEPEPDVLEPEPEPEADAGRPFTGESPSCACTAGPRAPTSGATARAALLAALASVGVTARRVRRRAR